MPKYKTLEEYVNTFNESALIFYEQIQQIISTIEFNVQQRLFAGQVAFYVEENLKKTFHSSPVIVLAFFKDHVNVFASANETYRTQLPHYTFTEKGTMQIYYSEELKKEILKKLFTDSLK
jgi:hypothetical protein